MRKNTKISEKQKRAFNNIMKIKATGKGTEGEALRDAGYSESMSKTPCVVTNSKGFLALMDKAGMTEENLAVMLSEDLRAKPANRLGELKLATELRGLKTDNVNLNVNDAEETMSLIRKVLDNDPSKE